MYRHAAAQAVLASSLPDNICAGKFTTIGILYMPCSIAHFARVWRGIAASFFKYSDANITVSS